MFCSGGPPDIIKKQMLNYEISFSKLNNCLCNTPLYLEYIPKNVIIDYILFDRF